MGRGQAGRGCKGDGFSGGSEPPASPLLPGPWDHSPPTPFLLQEKLPPPPPQCSSRNRRTLGSQGSVQHLPQPLKCHHRGEGALCHCLLTSSVVPRACPPDNKGRGTPTPGEVRRASHVSTTCHGVQGDWRTPDLNGSPSWGGQGFCLLCPLSSAKCLASACARQVLCTLAAMQLLRCLRQPGALIPRDPHSGHTRDRNTVPRQRESAFTSGSASPEVTGQVRLEAQGI